MRRTLFSIVITALAWVSYAPAIHAAGSGGGSSAPTYETNRRALSPEEQSAKALRAGIKHRDRALKHEARADKAKSDNKRERALAKAQKEYQKVIEKQGEAIRLDPQNYKAANELGFALRKTGDYRKAIGAYNYSLDINPNFHQAVEYRGEAFLALGMLDESKQSYMILFRNDRELAQQLMTSFDSWLADRSESELSPGEADFANWIEERKKLARITNDLSQANTRSW